jgi:CheY-like chemotaxis protein
MAPLKFLVVDDVSENRFLITKTLLRKFPNSLVQECDSSVAALAATGHDNLSAIIVHRAADADGLSLISEMRELKSAVPIVYVSGQETCPGALEAGATAFLNYDAWLRVGTVVEEVMAAEKAAV